ncbi:non-heme iron oxygenase ferredoxin subunit [Marinobacterium mangrovicola]|uniref:Ethylbenzene dioxygenase ferredoxin subunit n=1 Tax=Marinobacterium mangrovicola TaxID=1476959 RepID=A0A4R1GCG5_9GAMM|nr:non-heme iron oxygenase ferredoxin subunit [Marinobacterium mangrovicola]TCK04285.1 ethylbenzene dioxygenase ferredoxin subunit [Marinobacterium mangrovicola]
MDKVFLCKVSDLAENEVKKIDNSEHGDIAVYNLGGQYYATADLCTHATASLAEGDVEDDLIVCPVHWGQFHIPTGKAMGFPCEIDLRTYPVEVEGDDIYALVEAADAALIAKG